MLQLDVLQIPKALVQTKLPRQLHIALQSGNIQAFIRIRE
jgi:hypothetical protein